MLLTEGEPVRENGPTGAPITARALYVLLAISILTNVVLLARYPYARPLRALVLRMQTPPAPVADDHVRGDPRAAHTVIVYMDYQCPYCAELHGEMRSLIADNRARWIYRHFPLDIHPLAQSAAEAAECSGAQGKFWEYSDQLFEQQADLKDSTTLKAIAGKVGLDPVAFDACLASGRYRARVLAQQNDGFKRQITGTPTIYVDGKRYDGVLPIGQLRAALK